MIISNMLRNLNAGLRSMERYNDQLSSGKRLRVPSDHPGDTTRAMALRTQLVGVNQYSDNVKNALSWLEETDSALGKAGDVLNRAAELAVYGATGSLSPTDRAALAEEVDGLIHHLVQVANAAQGGRYLFGGHVTDKPPFEQRENYEQPPAYGGNSGEIRVEVSPGVEITINVPGDRAFSDLFQVLIDLRDALRDDDGEKVGGEVLGRLHETTDVLLRLRAEVGAKSNRLEATLERLGDLEVNVRRVLSDTEDVDVARAIMELLMEENVYRLALASTARIIQPTLMDFLR